MNGVCILHVCKIELNSEISVEIIAIQTGCLVKVSGKIKNYAKFSVKTAVLTIKYNTIILDVFESNFMLLLTS